MEVNGGERLWAITGPVVLISLLMQGLTITPLMRLLDRQQGRDLDAGSEPRPGSRSPGAG